MASPGSVTRLLLAWRGGDQSALGRLTPMVHPELQRIARRCLRGERAGHSLQATALVHEAYIRLVDVDRVCWQDRAHFLAMAARLMRRVLVEHARARGRLKRGGREAIHVSLSDAPTAVPERSHDVLALDEALERLAAFDARRSRVVELRVFGGSTVAETAAALSVSEETVMRDWKLALSWLRRELSRTGRHDS